ncbi:MAG: chromatin modification- protein VID21 [Geoglossum umbratile]|nr:MAG: chromatin modification- protein VID21 [Geoglossum umbratile]
MTLDVLSEGILRSKREEIAGVIQSRKRKLREVYAVARYVEYGEIIPPQFDANAEPPDQLEITFLDANDLLKGRFFDETTLPKSSQHVLRYNAAPRALRLDGDLQAPATPRLELYPRQDEAASSQAGLLSFSGYVPALMGRANAPKRSRRLSRSPVANGTANVPIKNGTQGKSKGSQIDLDVATTQLGAIADDATLVPQTDSPQQQNGAAPFESSDKDPIRSESPILPGRAKPDTAEAGPALAERTSETATTSEQHELESQITKPSPVDPRASNVKDISRQTVAQVGQDRKGDESRKRPPSLVVGPLLPVARGTSTNNSGINTPAAISSADTLPTPTSSTARPNGLQSATQPAPSMTGELPASPSSTVGESKASNTPGLNITSADTSPENEFMPANAEALHSKTHTGEFEEAPSAVVAYSPEEQVEMTQHNAFPLSEAHIPGLHGVSPTDANAQLRLEEQRAAKAIADPEQPALSTLVLVDGETTRHSDKLNPTKAPTEYVPDVMEEEEDEVVGVPTPEDGAIPEHRERSGSVLEKVDTRELEHIKPSSQERNPTVELDDSIVAIAQGHHAERVDVHEGDSRLEPLIESLPIQQNETHEASTGLGASGRGDLAVETPEHINLGRINEVAASPKTSTPSGQISEDVRMEDATVADQLNGADTPMGEAPAAVSVPSLPERMTTRVSSGAIKHKSVSEILGEIPKPNHSPQTERPVTDKPSMEPTRSNSATEISTPASGSNTSQPSSTRPRTAERKDKERSKLSTVTFAKQQPPKLAKNISLARRDPYSASKHIAGQAAEDINYLQVYHVVQTASQPLDGLLATAPKTITTADQNVNFHEMQDARLLRRMYSLQLKNNWSFRQMERSIEPERPLTHWDGLLDQMKWMRTDFREERKWKLVAAKKMADACKGWVTAPPDERVRLRIRTRQSNRSLAVPEMGDRFQDLEMKDGFISPVDLDGAEASHPTPDLVASAEDESISDGYDDVDVYNAVAPAEIFSLPPDDIVIGIRKTPTSEKLFHELPLYEPLGQHASDLSADAEWKTPIVPVSKYVLGKMVVNNNSPPRKRSRYEFEEDDDQMPEHKTVDIDPSYGFYRTPKPARFERSPERNDVALFNPENKPIRDRIHAGHLFRPPSEHPMPPQGFFECRGVAQWTFAEEEELKSLVKEYCYNWSLISSIVSSRSAFSSSAERRTPWECFERWISIEGLPLDMQKTQYFRALHSRLDAAKHPPQFLPGQHQGGPGGASLMSARRRDTRSVRVERRKNTRHLNLIDAIRKVAKKRETTVQKLQHAAGLAAMRKANEVQQPRAPVSTPQDFSRIKHERELKAQERHEQYRQQVLAQQRLAQQQRLNAQHQAAQQHSVGGGAPAQQRNTTPATGNAASPLVASSYPNGQSQASIPTQARQPGPLHNLPNGIAGMPTPHNGALPQVINGGLPMGAKGVPQAPMQGNVMPQPRHPMPPEHMRLVLENSRIQQEQRRFLQEQQQQQHLLQSQQGRSSSPSNMGSMNGSAAQAVMHNSPNMMAAFQAATSNGNGIPGPIPNSMNTAAGSSASPRMGQSLLVQTTQSQGLPNGMTPVMNSISHINQQMKAKYPQLGAEQIQRLTQEQIAREYRMTAMNAAAGSNNARLQQQAPGMMNGAGIPQSQQQQMYAQMMRAQQATQIGGIAGPGVANGANRPPSRSVTPQTQRTGSAQGQNQSPQLPQAQTATGQ